MSKRSLKKLVGNRKFPVFLERDEDGYYIVECPLFSGCYSQGRTMDEALKNIKEVIELCLEEEANQERIRIYRPQEVSLHAISL